MKTLRLFISLHWVASLLLLFSACSIHSTRSEGKDDIFDTLQSFTLPILKIESDQSRMFYTYYGEKHQPVLVRTNQRSATQTIYDYATKKLIDTHYWKNDSITGLRPISVGIDTIFSFMDGSGSYVSCRIGDRYYKESIPMRPIPGRIEQKPASYQPYVIVNDKWYFVCSRLGEYPEGMKSGKERFPLLELEKDMSHYRHFGEYPELYAHNNMGTTSQHWTPKISRSSDNQHVIVGFSATPDIYIYEPSTDQGRWVTAKSAYVDSIPLPFTSLDRNYFVQSESYYEFAQHSHYDQIIYDQWRNVYYRFVGLGLNDRSIEYRPFIFNLKKFVIMVMDTSFNVIGEQPIGDGYNMYHYFVTPDGLFIESKDSNETKATFTCFKLKDNKL